MWARHYPWSWSALGLAYLPPHAPHIARERETWGFELGDRAAVALAHQPQISKVEEVAA